MGLGDNLRSIEAEIASGRPEQALALCLELQTSYPRALALQRVLGETYLALRKPREALGALDRALAGNPEDARACCARAIVQQIHGDAASALRWYRRACDITPDDQVLRSAYRELATSQGQPAYRPTRLGLARLYLRGDLLSHAIREWESLLSLGPDSLEVQVGLAETLWRAGRLQPAADRCEHILSNSPACVKAILILAIIEHDSGHEDVAERLVRRTSDLDPDCRIGQQLCMDRLAGGDQALQALLLNRDPSPTARMGSTSQPLTRSSGATSGVFTRTHKTSTSRPLPEPDMFRKSEAKSASFGGPDTQSGSAVTGRGNSLPANFRSIFAETEYMLWGKETDDLSEISRISQPASNGTVASAQGTTSREDQFARSNVFVPPVLRDQGVNLDDTEARTSINFVNWLQAQGAVQQDGVPVPHVPVTRQLPSLDYAAQYPSASAISPREPAEPIPPAHYTQQDAPVDAPTLRYQAQQVDWHETPGESSEEASRVPAAQSNSDDLRRMFAELGAPTGALAEPPQTSEMSETSEPVLLLPEQEAEPSGYPERLERARARRNTGRIDQALSDYRLVLKNAPDLLAAVMDDLNQSLDEAPDHPEIHRLLGDAYIRQGNYLQALEAYNRAVALTQAQDGN